jgi:transketolase
MRNAFASEMTSLASEDNRIVLLSGDIGNRLFDDYKSHAPDRFINCGIAEANMIGVASGMAMCGLRPIAYTITPFITARCYEQIKVDVCYHNLPVIIVGVGGGLSYAELLSTHHSCDDIALLRILPNMTVICPSDSHEVRAALRAAVEHGGPVYIRLGKKNEPLIHEKQPEFTIGKGIVIREGRNVCMLSTGNLMPLALETAAMFGDAGISARVVSFHTVKPLDEDLLTDAFNSFDVVITLEEHGLLGGFGSSVSEWLVKRPAARADLLQIGVDDVFCYEAGKQEDARRTFNITKESIVERTRELYRQRSQKV